MATMGMSDKKGLWTGNDKGSGDGKQRDRGRNMTADTPLAAQLQQAWLQTQLPRRNVPKLDFLSPVPSSDLSVTRSSSASYPSSQSVSPDSDTLTSHSEAGSYSPVESSTTNEYNYNYEQDDLMNDPLLSYISDMLMEEDLCEKKCMFVECSAYQAMTKELADLIGDPNAADDMYCKDYEDGAGEELSRVTSWVDEVLDSHPSQYFDNYEHENSVETPAGVVEDSREAPPTDILASCASAGKVGGGAIRVNVIPQSGGISGVRAAREEVVGLGPECTYLDADTPRLTPGLDYAQGKSGIDSLTDLYPILMECAQAVSRDDVRQAHQLINRLRELSSPSGDGGQRLVHYFVEALVARLSGTGGRLYTALSSNMPSAMEMLKAYKLFVQCNPLPKIAHYFANKTIFDAVKGAKAVHIVDFGILYGVQWPCLIHALSSRPEGPPHLRITGIDFAQPGFKSTERIEDTGRRLAEKAKIMGIEFEYQAIAGKWEQIQPAQLNLRQDEVLIVNSMFRLRNLLDETVMASSPRKMLLNKIHSLNPELFVTGIVNAGYNTPFFMARFREAVNHYAAVFDAIHSAVPPIAELRLFSEREILGREILNVIACEGVERLERAENFTQWQSRITNAGFKQQPLDSAVIDKAREILNPFHKEFGVTQVGNWMLSGWKDRVLHGLTAWKP
ncbi:hypothetical protein Mapa_011009 [Marchantia paleacea]|nr:hypothetical protein Mapa_011009 [Marchantia paleacea]